MALLRDQASKFQKTLKASKEELKKETQVHELLMAVWDYLLKYDPAKSIETVITGILQKLISENIISFNIKTIEKRNQLEAYFTLTRNYDGIEIEQPILDCAGGGAADVAFLLLRIILLTNHPTDPRPALFCDEPVKNLSADKRDYFMDLLKKILHEFSIQLTMITHEGEYVAKSDCVFDFEMKGTIANAKQRI